MPQSPPNRGERDAGIAAGRFGDRVTLLNAAFLVCLLENVESHPVLDAAGHVEVLGLGIDDPLFSVERKSNSKQRRVADHVLQLLEARRSLADQCLCRQQRSDVLDCDLVLHRKYLNEPPANHPNASAASGILSAGATNNPSLTLGLRLRVWASCHYQWEQGLFRKVQPNKHTELLQ